MKPVYRNIAGALFVAILLAAFTVPADRYFEIARSLDIFATLFKEVNSHYVDEVDPEKMVRTGIGSMLQGLDPYTDYIPEEDAEAFSIMTTGEYAGIGALIVSLDSKIFISQPYNGFPAQLGGVRVGDEIVSVEGKPVNGFSTAQVTALLKGSPKTPVSMVVRRPGVQQEINLNLTRERINVQAVTDARRIDANTGYIRLSEFTVGASREMEEAMRKLKAEGIRSLILDLRDNPGGLLYEAVNISNLFLPKDKEVVSTRGKVKDYEKTYRTLNNPTDANLPLVVLVDGGSASAAEIVAGALQDHDRALLIGRKTFGKGLVQTTRELPYNGQLKITTARYYIPSGRCIQALDYSHRTKDGSAIKVADSLKNTFKTAGGRPVRDGGGLDPDIAVKLDLPVELLNALAAGGHLFLYANEWCATHPDPGDLRKFSLQEKDYSRFIAFLEERKFRFRSSFEEKLDAVEKAAKEQKAIGELEPALRALRGRLDDLLTRYKPAVMDILKDEIAFHLKMDQGRSEVSFTSDPDVLEAIRVLNDPAGYRKTLTATNGTDSKP
ncbi:MAG: S41 family peptidase [Bacteroidota bacterium]